MKKYTILLIISIVMFSCITKQPGGHDHGHGGHDDHEDHQEGEVHLTSKQIQTIGLELGDFKNIKTTEFVKATGTLGLPPNAYASVSAKTEGIIRGSKIFVEGNAIKKGAIIAYIENTDFIVKQQSYLETKAELNYKKLELDRQRTLVESNAGVTRNLQNAEAEFAMLEAKLKGLEKQLAFLGISASKLTVDSILQRIPIVAPMSGFISEINLHTGMYVQPSIPLMEIITDDHLHLELDVYEKDIAQIKVGQMISYTLPAIGSKVFEGEVSIIGKEFNSQSKSIRIHGHLKGEKPMFLKDLFINAKIWLTDETTKAVPESAVIMDGASTFIYITKNTDNKSETEFEKLEVITGATFEGYTSVKLLSLFPLNSKIVTKGAYYVYAQSRNGEMTHEH